MGFRVQTLPLASARGSVLAGTHSLAGVRKNLRQAGRLPHKTPNADAAMWGSARPAMCVAKSRLFLNPCRSGPASADPLAGARGSVSARDSYRCRSGGTIRLPNPERQRVGWRYFAGFADPR
jgi:hypothetical protein